MHRFCMIAVNLQGEVSCRTKIQERSIIFMYRRRHRRRTWRRREQRASLQRIIVGVSVICILIVCAAVALKTKKATQRVEAQSALMQALAVTKKTQMVQGQQKETEEKPEEEQEEDSWEQAAVRYQTEEVIIIDPGHGGMDGGCVFDDILEKDINRMIAAQVVARLRKYGYQAELAREGDAFIDKMERVENANAANALLYVSIHQNSCEDDSVEGIETWYDGSDQTRNSGWLAQCIQQETVQATGAKGRELVSHEELCVISKSAMPSCLIETGFLSNQQERDKLATKEYRDQIADGIVRGIVRYLTSDEDSGDEKADPMEKR